MAWSWVRVREWIWQMIGGVRAGSRRESRIGAVREGESEKTPSVSLCSTPPPEARGRRVEGSGWSLGWIVDWFVACMARLRLVKILGRGCAGWGIVVWGEGRLKGEVWRTRILRTDGVVGGCFLNAEGAEITQRWQRGDWVGCSCGACAGFRVQGCFHAGAEDATSMAPGSTT